MAPIKTPGTNARAYLRLDQTEESLQKPIPRNSHIMLARLVETFKAGDSFLQGDFHD